MLSMGYSGLLYITIPPMAFQLQPVFAQQVYQEKWWLIWVFLVPFLALPYDLFVDIC